MEDIQLDSLEGVGPVTIRKLSDAGINSIMEVIVRGPTELATITGWEKDTAERLVDKAKERLAKSGQSIKGFVDATDIYKRQQEIERISTGTDCLDVLFGGGVETQALTEVYGEFGCGKTQFCHTLCVMVQKGVQDGGLGGGVLYMDTENTFRSERIVSIAKANGMDPQQILDNIIVARADNSNHQVLLLEQAGAIIRENNIKLLVADSAVGLFRSEYLGRGTLSERQQKLNHFVHLLVRIAETYNIAAVATNSPGDTTKSTGGNVATHASTHRIHFKRSGEKRIACMVASPHHPEGETVFAISEVGIIDPVEPKAK